MALEYPYFYLNTRTWQVLYLIYAVYTLHYLYIMKISIQYTTYIRLVPTYCVKVYKGQESENVKSSIIGYFDFLPLLMKRFQNLNQRFLVNQ